MTRQQRGNYLLNADFLLKKAGIKQGDKVADLGCGASGHFVFPAAKVVGKHGTVYAVDILKKVLEIIKKEAEKRGESNIKGIWSDLEMFKGTNIENESIDTALLINTLFQSQKRPAILREAVRMLKKQGKLLVVEWENSDSPLGPPSESRVDKENLRKTAQKLGLKTEEEFNAGNYHYGILFIKM